MWLLEICSDVHLLLSLWVKRADITVIVGQIKEKNSHNLIEHGVIDRV